LEVRLPLFKNLPWGCSIRDVAWRDAGYSSSALEFLAYRAGFFYEGHRAEIDCRALLALLARPLGEAQPPALKFLLEHARQPTLKIYALNSPFETKDLLKERGYRWEPQRKVWVIELPAAEQDAELAWLKANVYDGSSVQIEVEVLDARVRYSERKGTSAQITL